MSNQRTNILFPIGRLVQGSCYAPRTTDIDGNPLKFKRGPNEGQPRVQYFIGVAIPKTMQNWRDESSPDPKVGNWGALIYNFARSLHPQRDIDTKFAWKIVDGDSTVKNDKGKAPCECEGFPGHWVIKAASSYAPALYDATGRHQLTEANLIKPGDYIRLYANITSNGSNQAQTMGIHINPEMVAYCGVGERIHLGADAANVFGDCQQSGPAGMQPIPTPANPYEGVQQPQQYAQQPQQYAQQPQQYAQQPQQYVQQPQQYAQQPQQPQQYAQQPQQYAQQPQQQNSPVVYEASAQQPQQNGQVVYEVSPQQPLTAPQPSTDAVAPSMTEQLING